MKEVKEKILNQLCYTELVYGRINKKLSSERTKIEIEEYISNTLKKTESKRFEKRGKNYYVTNESENIRLTVNSNTFRIITVDQLSKLNKRKK